MEHHLTFEPWADPVVDPFGHHPQGTYSRHAWLPIVGPSSWLVWGTVAEQLRHETPIVWKLTALAEAHGLQRGTEQHGMVRRTLARLVRFGLLADRGDDCYLVRVTAPPVSIRQLDRLPVFVVTLHREAFEAPRREAG